MCVCCEMELCVGERGTADESLSGDVPGECVERTGTTGARDWQVQEAGDERLTKE